MANTDPNVVPVNPDDQEAQLRALLGLGPSDPLPVGLTSQSAPSPDAKPADDKDSKDDAPKSDDKPKADDQPKIGGPVLKSADQSQVADLLAPQFAPDQSKFNMTAPIIKGAAPDDNSSALLAPQFAPDQSKFSVMPQIFKPDDAAPSPMSAGIAGPGMTGVPAPDAAAPGPTVGGPVLNPNVSAAQQKLADLKQQGSGVSHHHGFTGGLLKALDIAGTVVAPGIMQDIPGTTLNFKSKVNAAQSGVGQAMDDLAKQTQLASAQADLRNKQNPTVKEGTPEQQAMDDLTNQINPKTGKNYTASEAFQKVSELKEGAKPPKEGDEPLTNADNITKALERSYQSGHPGQPLPDEYKLPPNATIKDLTRIQSLLKDARDSEQNKASKDVLNEMHRQTMSIQAANAAGKNQKKSVEEQGIEAAAQSLAKMDPNDLSSLKDIASLRGDQRLLIYNRAKEINPQFNTAEVNRKIKMMDNFTNGADGKSLQSFGTFLEHAGEASTVVDGIRNTSMPLINKPLNWFAKNAVGDPNYVRLLAALEPVKAEAENFMLNGHAMHVEDKKSIDAILSADSSPAQIQAAVKQLGHTVQARYNEMDNRYNGTMKQHLPPESLSEEARNGASKIGLKFGQSSGSAASQSGPPKGATHTAPGSDGRMHWTDGKSDLGVVQ
jgi:hypothetical protein